VVERLGLSGSPGERSARERDGRAPAPRRCVACKRGSNRAPRPSLAGEAHAAPDRGGTCSVMHVTFDHTCSKKKRDPCDRDRDQPPHPPRRVLVAKPDRPPSFHTLSPQPRELASFLSWVPPTAITDWWEDTAGNVPDKVYVVGVAPVSWPLAGFSR
jgi:hypothetical protein